MNKPFAIDFPGIENQHICKSYRDNDWIVFWCEKCPDYERRINWRTQEMRVRNSNPDINHTGSYFHPALNIMGVN